MDVVLIGRVLGGMLALAAALGGLGPAAVRAAVDDPMRPPADVLQARLTGAAPVPQVSQVQAIKRQNGVATALVTGRWVRVGDALEGGRITHITDRGVTLAKGSERLLLPLGPASVSSPGGGGVSKP